MRTNEQYNAPSQFIQLPEISLSDSSLVSKHPVLQFLQQQVTAKELAGNTGNADPQSPFIFTFKSAWGKGVKTRGFSI
jgi:hypothetical protein